MATSRKFKTELTPDIRLHLLRGFCFEEIKLADSDLQSLWGQHHNDLLSFWAQDPDEYLAGDDFHEVEPGGPGTRPWSWWRWDAPEERKILSQAHIVDQETRLRGEPEYDSAFMKEYPLNEDDRQETEYAYLHRLKLFAKTERDYFKRFPKIKPDDWDYLFRKGWTTARDRAEWRRIWFAGLTEKGKRSRDLDLGYLDKLNIKPEETK